METADRSEFDLLPSHQAERSEQLAVDVLRVISASLGAGSSLESFYRSLTAKVADLVGASRVLFWQLGSDHMLRAIPGAHGVDDDFIKRLYPAPCYPEGTDLTSQVVYRDLIFRAALGDPNQSPRYRRVLDVLQVSNAMRAPDDIKPSTNHDSSESMSSTVCRRRITRQRPFSTRTSGGNGRRL